jgi:hypothetical protein
MILLSYVRYASGPASLRPHQHHLFVLSLFFVFSCPIAVSIDALVFLWFYLHFPSG